MKRFGSAKTSGRENVGQVVQQLFLIERGKYGPLSSNFEMPAAKPLVGTIICCPPLNTDRGKRT